jgi:hypothetical protein
MYALLCCSLSVAFELYDFSPLLFGLLDAHSLWHASALLMIHFWHQFILLDLRISRSPSQANQCSVTTLIVLHLFAAYLQLVVYLHLKITMED